MTSKRKTVMVVDDSETDLLWAQLMLQHAGIADQVLMMGSALEALAHLSGPGPGVHLILLDVHMPVMDGFGFLARHGQRGSGAAPVVMLSASPDPADVAAPKPSGSN